MQDQRFHVKGFVKKAEEADGTIHAAIASSEVIDRMGEVVDIEGMDLRNFKKNPILLWAHNASFTEDRPPIGKIVKTWVDGIKKKKLMFSVKFDMGDPFAQLIYRKYVEGFLNAFSIGFQVLERDENVFTKTELLEISAVPVPANPEALVALKSVKLDPVDWKAFFEGNKALTSTDMKDDVKPDETPEVKPVEDAPVEPVVEDPKPEQTSETPDVEVKKAVPYFEIPMAPENTVWEAVEAKKRMAEASGGPDKAKMDWVSYRKGFAWFNDEAMESLKSYKFPHHDIVDGQMKTIWRGVAAAMAALLGARGTADMPEDEKKAVYNHLKKEYERFGKEVPEFRSLVDIKETFEAILFNKKELDGKEVEEIVAKTVEKYKPKPKVELSDGRVPEELRDVLKVLVTTAAIALSRIKQSRKEPTT